LRDNDWTKILGWPGWLTNPIKNKIIQVTTAFLSILAITHLAGVVFEAVAMLGVFALNLLTGQALARMDKPVRETCWRTLPEEAMNTPAHRAQSTIQSCGMML